MSLRALNDTENNVDLGVSQMNENLDFVLKIRFSEIVFLGFHTTNHAFC